MNTPLPLPHENPAGLHQRYKIERTDGTPIDPRAVYFVLRLDRFGGDPEHIEACRAAAHVYADNLPSRLAQLAVELREFLEETESV